MYYLKTEASFDSAHFLKGYQGKCANIHGHRWRVVVTIESQELLNDSINQGMIVDFGDLKADLKTICDDFDHALIIEQGSLNDQLLSLLQEENFKVITLPYRPTAENLAYDIYQRLSHSYQMTSVDVYETPNNMASYRGDHHEII